MFGCTRSPRPSKKVREKVDFRLQFHATQVPHIYWDKLFLSLVALDSGRITARTRKVSVRNGHCQWPDLVQETVKLFLDTRTLQYDEKLYKFVVAKRLSRSCILGEVIFNISDYVGSSSPTSVTLPLRFCYAGTLLHVTLQCLTPKVTMDKPFRWLNHGSDGDTELRSPCRINSPLHCFYPTFSMGNDSPVASSATDECSRVQSPSPSSSASSHAIKKFSRTVSMSYASLTSPNRKQKDIIHAEIEDSEIPKHEHEVMKSELEQLKKVNEALVKEKLICEDHICIIQELKGELGQEKRTNSILNALPRKLREANIELLLTIRELEDTLQAYTKHSRLLAEYKVHSNHCAEDRIIDDLDRKASECDEVSEEQDVPRLKLFVSTFAEGLNNLKLVMEELERHPGRYTFGNKQLVAELEALVEGSKLLISDLQRRSNPDNNEDANYAEQVNGHMEAKQPEDVNTQLKDLVMKVTELTEEKIKLESMLSCYVERKDIQASTKDQQLCTEVHAEKPEEMSMQLKELEAMVDELKTEKTKLQCMLRSCREQECASRAKIEQLEAQLEFRHEQVPNEDELEQGVKSLNKLKYLETKVEELTMEKTEVESVLKSYTEVEEYRARTMDQLEAQVMEFARELDTMQESSEQLETVLLATKAEKEKLEDMLKYTKTEADTQTVKKLEDEIKRLKEEREADCLEKCIVQNLIRDLWEHLQKYIPGASDQEHKQDFIFHVKELRTSFFTLMKDSEDRQSMEDRMNMMNEKVMATISILDKQFGEVLKESDQKLAACNEEIEFLCSKVEELVKKEKTQGFLRNAIEENACEIAYLRDELRRRKDECQEIEDEKLELKNRCEQAEMELEQSKKTICSLEKKVTSFETKLEVECDRFDTLQAKVRMLEHDMESTCQDFEDKAIIISGKMEDLEVAYEQTDKHEKSRYEHLIQDLKQQNQELEHKMSELRKEKENAHVQCQSQEVEKQIVTARQAGNGELQTICTSSTSVKGRINQLETIKQENNKKCERRKWKQHSDQDIKELRSKAAALEKREGVLCEKIVHLEAMKKMFENEAIKLRECEAAKVELEATIKQLQSQLQNESVLGKSECARLKRENEQLKIEKQSQREVTSKVQFLEAQIQELLDAVANREAEAEGLKQEIQERESNLWKKIECLEVANEQLAVQQVDSGVDQLKMELIRLQNHNSELSRREHELTSKINTYELLQYELQRLQKENELLEREFSKLKQASLWGDTLERLVYLETELAEALETNNMYKMELQNVFAKQRKGKAGGDAEEIISNLVSFKKQTCFLEGELKEMQERYMKMSMRFAEIHCEREELLMTIKTLRSTNSTNNPKV